jgi:hypothetical protein
MQQDDVLRKARRKPFRPFRLHLTDGQVYTVRHPEMILVGRRTAVVGVAADPDQDFFDQAVDVDLFHIVRMDFLDEPSGGSSAPTTPGSDVPAGEA